MCKLKSLLAGLLVALSLMSFSANAQILFAADSVSVLPNKRGNLYVNESDKSITLRFNNGTVTNKYKAWLNGIKMINNQLPDANGRLTLPVNSTLLSAYNNDIGFLLPTSTLTTSKLTGTISASNVGALTGDVTSSAGSYATLISSAAVTNAKLANMPVLTFKGNNTTAVSAPLDVTVPQALSALNLDRVNNTNDSEKPLSVLAISAVNGAKTTPFTTTTTLTNGSVFTHNLNKGTRYQVFVYPGNANNPDLNYGLSAASTATTITLAAPYDSAAGAYEVLPIGSIITITPLTPLN